MRKQVTVERLHEFMKKLGLAAKGPGTVFFTGGATALLLGIREQTIDVDLKLDPEPAGVFEAIARLKNELDLNIELAAPDDFIPPHPNWRANSIHIATINSVAFYHYDLAMQVLAKLERGHDQDLRDVKAFLQKGLVAKQQLLDTFSMIREGLLRYPAIEADAFEKRVGEFLDQWSGEI